MKKLTILILFGLFSVLLSGCKVIDLLKQSPEEQPRTYYETLDLSTPESAVKTFVDAFQRDDFMAVYLILSPRTQFFMNQRINLLQYKYFFQIEYREEVFEEVTVFSKGLGAGEHADEMWYLFDQMMLSAKEHDALLIDLSGEVNITETKASETDRGDEAMDVSAEVEGIEGEVVFRMVQAPSERWRVYQVIVEGGDEEGIPWAVPGLSD